MLLLLLLLDTFLFKSNFVYLVLRMEHLLKAFNFIDSNKDGIIDKNDLVATWDALGIDFESVGFYCIYPFVSVYSVATCLDMTYFFQD